MDLRNFISSLEDEGLLTRIKKEVSVEYEIANIIYSLNEKPVIFENVKGFDFPIFVCQDHPPSKRSGVTTEIPEQNRCQSREAEGGKTLHRNAGELDRRQTATDDCHRNE